MSLKDERDYQYFQSLLTYDELGTKEDPGPYWRARLPFVLPRDKLVDNKAAVIGVMNATAKKLGKEPAWRKTYEAQISLHD